MSTFTRNASAKWHGEVPGARWFKGDLHLHTLDDHPSGNLKWPDGVTGSPTAAEVHTAYARAFLRGAIAKGIEVLGLTPHAVKAGSTDDSCVVWRIVDVWNNDNDDDGIPFREKIYAVFPGFEPNLIDGSDGLHLLFLFDPEIGRTNYLEAFAAVMAAIPPWRDGSLQISSLDTKTACGALHRLHERSNGEWNHMCLAAHAFSTHGLFTLRSQVLQAFPHHFIAGLELKDNWLPEDAFADKPWLKDGLKEHRHALFHASDAYAVGDIGKRFTLFKLAQPRIGALRQSFLASDSRMRIAYQKENGQLVVRADLPDAKAGNRPWLRTVKVKGGTSFFAGTDRTTNQPREQTFRLNPDLTCIIGGRMSGKSTLLDGLRVHCDHPLPDESDVKIDVERRAGEKFLSGSPAIMLDIRGPVNPTASAKERWPARFFTQRELQKAVRDQKIRRQILFRLIPSESI